MGTTSLRHLLKSLCHNSPWKYAVFWKLKHDSGILLTWEDWYCDYSKPEEPAKSMSDSVCFSQTNGAMSFGCETSTYNGSSVGDPIELAVENMSCLLYSLGEGVVGKVASTEKHCWVFCDSVYAGTDFKVVPEYPDEWLLQFAAGIKTILLVPVPHGVVQLGSLEMVNEDPTLLTHIKDMFNNLEYVAGISMPLTSNCDLALPPSLVTSLLLENLAEPLAITGNLLSPIQLEPLLMKDPVVLSGVQITKKLPTISPRLMPMFTIPGKLQVPGTDADFGALAEGSTEVSFPQNQAMIANHLEMMGGNIFNFPCLEDLQASSECFYPDIGIFEMNTGMNTNFSFAGDTKDQPFGDDTINGMDHRNVGGFESFPVKSELHKAFGPAFQERCNEYLWDPTISVEDVCGSLNLTCHRDFTDGIEPLVGDSDGWFKKGGDVGHLLTSVVARVDDNSGNTTSNRPNSVRSTTTSSGDFALSCQTQSQSEGSFLLGDFSAPWINVSPAIVTSGKKVPTITGSSSSKSMMSTLTDEEQQKKEYGCMQSRGGRKLSHAGRKRARPSETQKPRPRDRQLIQDRVKELRELVPDGAKCSMDALLVRTIKHMLFLKSVTDRAEKLRRYVHPKVSRNNWDLSGALGHQTGTSWAFEMGSQVSVPPIVVQDLDHPGRMLIEMLCEQYGVFLEIVQIIQRLELTILKGVMETRTDELWAHFVIEAPGGFQRMEVFWPLMQLLQRNNKSISTRF